MQEVDSSCGSASRAATAPLRPGPSGIAATATPPTVTLIFIVIAVTDAGLGRSPVRTTMTLRRTRQWKGTAIMMTLNLKLATPCCRTSLSNLICQHHGVTEMVTTPVNDARTVEPILSDLGCSEQE